MDASDELFVMPFLGVRREQEDRRCWCVPFSLEQLREHPTLFCDGIVGASHDFPSSFSLAYNKLRGTKCIIPGPDAPAWKLMLAGSMGMAKARFWLKNHRSCPILYSRWDCGFYRQPRRYAHEPYLEG